MITRRTILCARGVQNVTAVGFEPTPFRTGALSQRLRPLGQTVLRIWHERRAYFQHPHARILADRSVKVKKLPHKRMDVRARRLHTQRDNASETAHVSIMGGTA